MKRERRGRGMDRIELDGNTLAIVEEPLSLSRTKGKGQGSRQKLPDVEVMWGKR